MNNQFEKSIHNSNKGTKKSKVVKKPNFKVSGVVAGLMTVGLVIGFILGKRSADEEFYEVSYEDL